jgi:hypothetical protein
VEKAAHRKKLYRCWTTANGPSVEMESVPVGLDSLDPRFIFLFDCGDVLWVWSGAKSRVGYLGV